MAVFLVNICKFKDCSQKFSTLRDLIHHIEEIHIASDPGILEKQESQQPSSLPLSYVLRLCERENRERVKVRQRTSSVSPVPSLSSHTGSEFDDEDRRSEVDNSDDCWTNRDTLTSDIILSLLGSHKDSDSDKPFVCPVPGCNKRYKNINGIKYHAKNGHKKDIRIKKPFRCKCGKSYQSASGLRHHNLVSHPLATTLPIVTDVKIVDIKATSLPLATTLPIYTDSTAAGLPLATAISLATNTVSASLPLRSNSIVNINSQRSKTKTVTSPKTLVATTTNCATLPVAHLTSKSTILNHHATLSSLLPNRKACSSFPPGTLTFAMPSGGVQVAVPVSRVISLPNQLDTGSGAMDCGMDMLEPFGALETVETFNGLETSIDDTKAD